MTADTVHFWANWLLIISLVVGVASTFAIVTSGNIKEKSLRRELSTANADAEKAKATAAEANTRTAKLNLRVGEEARKRAEAEFALETLKEKLRIRSLTLNQRDILVLSLRHLSGTRILVGSMKDKDSTDYAGQFISIFNEVGLRVDSTSFGNISSPKYGIIISPDPSLSVFHDAFKKAQINYTTGQIPGPNIGIFIGLKPPIDT